MHWSSDEELIDRIKAGDTEALNHWLAKNRSQLIRWTEDRLGVPSGRGADASDLVQNATFYVADHIQDFRGQTEAELLSWLHQTLRCRAIDMSRKPKTQVIAPLSSAGPSPSGADPWTRVKADCSTPSQSAARHEEEERINAVWRKKQEQIHGARDCLSDQQLHVFLQREVGQLHLKAIATDLGLTAVETAKLFYQARSLLQGKVPLVDEDDGTPAARLRQALRPLPDRQRQAIELKHVEGYSLEEIGEVMDCNATAVGSMIYRGMMHVKGHVSE
ncbi:MAG: sigma factor-like helix-turn-helix DNA-binding protein [Thermoguttaceae bacterium]